MATERPLDMIEVFANATGGLVVIETVSEGGSHRIRVLLDPGSALDLAGRVSECAIFVRKSLEDRARRAKADARTAPTAQPSPCWCGETSDVEAIRRWWCRQHAPRCPSGVHVAGACECKGASL